MAAVSLSCGMHWTCVLRHALRNFHGKALSTVNILISSIAATAHAPQEVRAMVAAQTTALQDVLSALRLHGIRILTYSELGATGAKRYPHSSSTCARQ